LALTGLISKPDIKESSLLPLQSTVRKSNYSFAQQ
jgi:hypothetical protein